MPVHNLTIVGRRFVILPEAEYKLLRRQAKSGMAKRDRRQRPQRASRSKSHRLTAQDRGDIAESLHRLKEPGEISLEDVKERLRI